MIGSLVVVLPVAYQGGSLILRQNSQEWVFDSGKTAHDPNLVNYVAFYSDVEHEITPVTSGHRVTLTYNLYSRTEYPQVSESSAETSLANPFKAALRDLLADESFMPSGGRLAFALSHQYPYTRPQNIPEGSKKRARKLRQDLKGMFKILKGSDAHLHRVCKELGLASKLAVAYEVESYWAYYKEKKEDYDDEEEQDDDEDKADTKDYNVTAILDSLVDTCNWWNIEDDIGQNLVEYNNAEIIKKRKKGQVPTFVWATKPKTLNRIQESYIAYGNEASLGYLYGDVCLLVDVGDSARRKRKFGKLQK
jgi:hypothetical protein